MELLLVRHGPAGDPAKWAKSGRADRERPLTPDGRRKTRAAAAGLAEVFGRCDLVATSSWRRSAQTSAIVAKALGASAAVDCPALAPGSACEDLLAWLKTRRERRVALVGHEPQLSRFASWLMTGAQAGVLRLKKSQALLLEMEKAAAGGAVLVWSLAPRQLRALAR
ncbi:MAG TPA: hypothetical protein DCZ01_08625 [Elusimicrobia bacterium]|nr:MAG: hypothetical protein A2X37_08650 [Elusimicrobia bacterium GWA2_66_18]OGR72973.1 MAG: hypothetical protein A2X40_02500 [Elusimicrobia bacterium GWC2_65_9]HAZ08567.1 hypothetical protein [Elusimicrobiota bacterium]